MPCDDCSTDDDECRCGPGEMCGACFDSRIQPEDVPRILKLVEKPEPEKCRFTIAGKPHCFDHVDSRCCGCDLLDPEAGKLRPCTCGPDEACGDPCDYEPPITPEEEEEAPEDLTLPPPEGPEYTPCVCGHIVPEHEPHGGLCFVDECGCTVYMTRAEMDEEATCKACGRAWDKRHVCPPPQPDRRPPFLVAYSVSGHLYEVALPGDATVKAVDGALVIQHHLGPVAGIVQVLPVINEEQT